MLSGAVTILRLLSGPEYGPPLSQTLSSRLLCLTRSTLELAVGIVVVSRSSSLSRPPDTTASAQYSAVVSAACRPGHDSVEHIESALKRFWCSRRQVAVFNDPFCFRIWSGTLRARRQLLGYLHQLVKGIFALFQHDIRSRLHHCWANSLVDVCDAVAEGSRRSCLCSSQGASRAQHNNPTGQHQHFYLSLFGRQAVNVHKATICTKHGLPVFKECH